MGFITQCFNEDSWQQLAEHTVAESKKHTYAYIYILEGMYTHIVGMVAEECSVILVCVNDSPRHTGEDVKNWL